MKRPSREARNENTPSAGMVAHVLDAYVHDQAHAVAWRLAEENRQVADAISKRVEELESDMTDSEGNMMALMNNTTQEVTDIKNRMDGIVHQVNDAITNMEVPDHISEALAGLENKIENEMSDMNDRVSDLEDKMTELVDAIKSLASVLG
jgi:chromosome segregation ATPase